eukprot:14932-Heterococcus_DN1.PRE.3
MHSIKLNLITLLLAVAFWSCSEAAQPIKSLKKVNRRLSRRLSQSNKHVLERAVRLRGGAVGVQAVDTLEEVQSILHDAGEQLSVIYFTASWCSPCQQIKPIYDALAAELGASAHFLKVDVDEYVPA